MAKNSAQTIQIAIGDLNGQLRGKSLPSENIEKVETGSVRMPLSALTVDIFGNDIENSPLVFETGDADGNIRPTERAPFVMEWLENAPTMYLGSMYTDDGKPFDGDPRHALKNVLTRYEAHGWSVSAATEMEFYLVDDRGEKLEPPTNPTTGRKLICADVLSVQELNDFGAFFNDVYSACEAMNITVETITSEAGCGQFEVTLMHRNALDAADDAALFKMMLKGVARKHGFAATFMAKPFVDQPGNGMHTHFSVVDENGNNIFDNGDDEGTEILRHAVAGCLAAMPASTLIFAPHGNSYSRLVPDAHAPTGVCWAYENRTVAIRIPAGNPKARRIEHRVAGGDINPYLLFSVIMGAAINGIEQEMNSPEPISGNAYEADLEQLAPDWQSAITAFTNSSEVANILPKLMIENLSLTKQQELDKISEIPEHERWSYWVTSV